MKTYSINDENAKIRAIQEKLRVIGTTENISSFTSLYVNGIYDERTRSAVSLFQEINNLEKNGRVDELTYRALDDLYRIAVVKNDAPKSIPFPLRVGDTHREMNEINRKIKTVLEYYYGSSDVRISTYYSESTRIAVKALQKAFMLAESGEIDSYFYSRLADEADSVELQKKFPDA